MQKLLFKTSNATFVVKKRLVNYMSIISSRMTGLPLTSQRSHLCSGRMQHTTVTLYYLCWRNKPPANHVSLLCKYSVAEFHEITHPRHCILRVPCTGSQKGQGICTGIKEFVSEYATWPFIFGWS